MVLVLEGGGGGELGICPGELHLNACLRGVHKLVQEGVEQNTSLFSGVEHVQGCSYKVCPGVMEAK